MEYISPDIDYATELDKIYDELNDLMNIDEVSAYEFMQTAYAEEIEDLRAELSNEIAVSLYLDSFASLFLSAPANIGEYGAILDETIADLKNKNEEKMKEIAREIEEKKSLLEGLTQQDAYATLCCNIEFYEMRLRFLAERLEKIQREK